MDIVLANDKFMLEEEVEVEILSPSFSALEKARNKPKLFECLLNEEDNE
ncbi:hypothetical protein [Halalkalibacter lacteus]